MTLVEDARALGLAALRRTLHASPEVGLQLPRTQRLVLDALDGLGLDLRTGTALTSVVGVVRGAHPGPTVLLRADLDALPFPGGPRHACGHDQHAAMLVGAARLLAARRDRLHGDVLLMFQPGEEGHDGARLMLAEGLLETTGSRPVAAYALHSAAAAPLGQFGNIPGPALAASATLAVTLHGAGGHGAWPHRARDPIPATGELLLALQTLVPRQFDVFEPAILSVGSVHAGSGANIIPAEARIEATLRSLDDAVLSRLARAAERAAHGVASAHGLRAEVVHTPGYPATVNDPTQAAVVADTVAELFGPERFAPARHPGLVADDIGRVLAEVPGVMTSVGACPPDRDPATAPGNHAPDAVFDDAVLPDGAALLAQLALAHLRPPGTTHAG
ncbi:M20 metallopeptidase family protein [Streptacidiphilus jiangxiensis]|uniref:Hippurate hydrolase n=1 Tax=Streptacidiphilus jiangxiensis TaxID=235985 RepID=A0A1H7TEV1_STRJI|nr:M20 family metallopeptidase [Streptacidiphilus jiangxiensis]SEL82377.1 hippurate hydrolase [Streptacidiphilus jiangxiensis]